MSSFIFICSSFLFSFPLWIFPSSSIWFLFCFFSVLSPSYFAKVFWLSFVEPPFFLMITFLFISGFLVATPFISLCKCFSLFSNLFWRFWFSTFLCSAIWRALLYSDFFASSEFINGGFLFLFWFCGFFDINFCVFSLFSVLFFCSFFWFLFSVFFCSSFRLSNIFLSPDLLFTFVFFSFFLFWFPLDCSFLFLPSFWLEYIFLVSSFFWAIWVYPPWWKTGFSWFFCFGSFCFSFFVSGGLFFFSVGTFGTLLFSFGFMSWGLFNSELCGGLRCGFWSFVPPLLTWGWFGLLVLLIGAVWVLWWLLLFDTVLFLLGFLSFFELSSWLLFSMETFLEEFWLEEPLLLPVVVLRVLFTVFWGFFWAFLLGNWFELPVFAVVGFDIFKFCCLLGLEVALLALFLFVSLFVIPWSILSSSAAFFAKFLSTADSSCENKLEGFWLSIF